jgi:hypothetical protein
VQKRETGECTIELLVEAWIVNVCFRLFQAPGPNTQLWSGIPSTAILAFCITFSGLGWCLSPGHSQCHHIWLRYPSSVTLTPKLNMKIYPLGCATYIDHSLNLKFVVLIFSSIWGCLLTSAGSSCRHLLLTLSAIRWALDRQKSRCTCGPPPESVSQWWDQMSKARW